MLKGNNVCLKLLEKLDIQILYNLYNDENIKKYNLISNDEVILNYERMNNLIKCGINTQYKTLRKALTIINENNALIGFITYKKSKYLKDVYYIGITIGKNYWNMGYGKEAIKILIKYLFEELKAKKIKLEVMKYNYRAINCYKKCGFLEVGTNKNRCCLDGKYVDTIIMELVRYF